MKTKIKKLLSVLLLTIYFIGIYWFLSQITRYPLAIIVTMLASILFMIVTHELGHLLFGLLTGYRFISFRVFSVMLVKTEGKWVIRRMSLPGTGGQCLMAPPPKKNGNFPFVLYHLGGILFCGFLSLIPIVIGLSGKNSDLRMLFFVFGFVSFVMNVLNAIPTGGKGMINDATNVQMARKSASARLACWNQLAYVALHAQNIRTADMPEELFFLPDKRELSNHLLVWQILACVERCEDMGEYEQARETVRYALEHAPFIFPWYQSALQAEAVYLDSILGTNTERTSQYYDQIQKIPAFQNTISFHRALYAYLLLQKKDAEGAQKVLLALKKKICQAPFRAEAIFESNQLSYIQALQNP